MAKRGEISDEEIIQAYRELMSPKAASERLGISLQNLHRRRLKIQQERGITLPVIAPQKAYTTAEVADSRAVYRLGVTDGVVLVGSDFHVWPGERTTMQRAFVQFAKKLNPVAVIANGDVFDGARVSRHPSIGWEHKPSVKHELEAVRDFLGDVAIAAGNAKRIWPCGNHDARFESRIAAMVPELEGVQGMHLKDHIPEWEPCWRVDINDDIVVKHRMRGGEHADWNNVVKSGKTTVTGHDHRTGVVPYRDYRGLRWGVRCGYMGESPLDPQFVHYMEADEANWHPAFAVLSFRNGRLLWPELVTKHDDGRVEFRGDVIDV